jgi:hypothetical protein
LGEKDQIGRPPQERITSFAVGIGVTAAWQAMQWSFGKRLSFWTGRSHDEHRVGYSSFVSASIGRKYRSTSLVVSFT